MLAIVAGDRRPWVMGRVPLWPLPDPRARWLPGWRLLGGPCEYRWDGPPWAAGSWLETLP